MVRWSDVQDDFQFKSIRKEREYSAKIRKSKAVSNIKPNFAHSFMDRLQISLFILSEFINLFPPEIIRVQGKQKLINLLNFAQYQERNLERIPQKINLKLVSAIFYQIFIFSPKESPSNYKKCFLFHRKSSFRSQDIQIFVFFPFFSTLPRFKRTNRGGIIYDVKNWLA